jgi:membrane protease YdiL (CAAX protease family)
MLTDSPPRRDVVLLALVVEGSLGILALGLGWLSDCLPWQSWSWDLQDVLWALSATVPLLLLFFLCVRWPLGPLVPIKQFVETVIKPLFQPCSLVDLAAISVLAGLGEEMLFRGVLQTVFSRWLPLGLALALASVLFGLLHWITTMYAVLATLMGAYLGWLYLHSGNLMVAALTHALYDFVALTYLVKSPLAKAEQSS